MRRDIDVLLDDDGDLLLDGEEPVVGDVTLQNQQLILSTNKGDWKLSPLTGVGVENFIDDENASALAREIRMQFKKDGLTIKSIKINNANIEIDASYLL